MRLAEDRQRLRTSHSKVRWVMAAAVLILSFSAIFIRLSGSSPVTVSFFRAVYALPFLLVLRRLLPAPTRSWRHRSFALVAGLILAGNNAAWHVAIELMGAGLATVVGSTHVVMMVIVGWIAFSERPNAIGIASSVAVLGGVVLISGIVGSGAAGADPARGALYGILMAICYVAYLLLIRNVGSAGASPVATLADVTAAAAAGSLLLAPLDPRFSLMPTWPAHAWLLALAVGAQVVGWLVITYVLPLVEAWESSVLLVLEPAATVIWAYLIFSEVFSTLQLVGLVVVVVGVAVTAASRGRSVAKVLA